MFLSLQSERHYFSRAPSSQVAVVDAAMFRMDEAPRNLSELKNEDEKSKLEDKSH